MSNKFLSGWAAGLLVGVLMGGAAPLAWGHEASHTVGAAQTVTVKKINSNIFMAMADVNANACNTYLVNTPEGSVVIDTSSVDSSQAHFDALKPLATGPIKYIILTHGHGDHTGGVNLWKQAGTQVIAQSGMVELLNYQTRLRGFLLPRNAAQAGLPAPVIQNPNPGNFVAEIPADTFFDKTYKFTLGGLTFKLYSTPGETPDQLNVWIPELKAAFAADNFYDSFPNIYSLRGTKPRWALEWVDSVNLLMSWKPKHLLLGHGEPLKSADLIQQRLTKFRDAVQYVHDAVVAGMNAGTDVYTLMRTVKLPPELDLGETYGRVSWSVRGIYEGYAGWFDTNAVTMYHVPLKSALPELVGLIGGGADTVAQRARALLNAEKYALAVHVADAALTVNKTHAAALQVRIDALTMLRNQAKNGIERNWLQYNIDKALTLQASAR